MGTKLTIILLILSSFLVRTLRSYTETHQPDDDDSGHPDLHLGKEKITKLRFYLQDVLGGDHPTGLPVAKSNLTDILPSQFGLVMVLDNAITSEPNIHSKHIGRMQEVIAFTDLRESVLTMLFNVVFTEGKYNGSTLSILGRNPVNDETRELTIVGGSGAFRMARGYAITRTWYVNKEKNYGIYQYDVVVYHYNNIKTF